MVLDLEFSNDSGQFIVNLCFSNFQCLQIQVPSKLISAFQRSNHGISPMMTWSGAAVAGLFRFLQRAWKSEGAGATRWNQSDPTGVQLNVDYRTTCWWSEGWLGSHERGPKRFLTREGSEKDFFLFFRCSIFGVLLVLVQSDVNYLDAKAGTSRLPYCAGITEALRDSICINFFSL